MFELTKEEIEFLLNEYDITKRALKLIALTKQPKNSPIFYK